MHRSIEYGSSENLSEICHVAVISNQLIIGGNIEQDHYRNKMGVLDENFTNAFSLSNDLLYAANIFNNKVGAE
jgi:hypothetical protein